MARTVAHNPVKGIRDVNRFSARRADGVMLQVVVRDLLVKRRLEFLKCRLNI
jgi:hypothetical protein